MKRKGKHLVLRIFLVVLLAALVIFAAGLAAGRPFPAGLGGGAV